MTGKSKQLSGTGKDRYLDRLIRDEPGIPADAAERIAAKAKAQIASVRVRRDEEMDLRPLRGRQPQPGKLPSTRTDETPPPDRQAVPEPATSAGPPASAPNFDPYAFGLVPVYQREGREGLIARLAAVSDPAHLRLLAQKQQISLRAELRSGDIAADVLREAIVAAVEKRIADRRAAAS